MATDIAEFVGAAAGLNMLTGLAMLPSGFVVRVAASGVWRARARLRCACSHNLWHACAVARARSILLPYCVHVRRRPCGVRGFALRVRLPLAGGPRRSVRPDCGCFLRAACAACEGLPTVRGDCRGPRGCHCGRVRGAAGPCRAIRCVRRVARGRVTGQLCVCHHGAAAGGAQAPVWLRVWSRRSRVRTACSSLRALSVPP